MGATTPGKPVKGEPPKGMGEGGPKVTPAPLPKEIIDPPRTKKSKGPKVTRDDKFEKFLEDEKRKSESVDRVAPNPGLFGQLMEGIKKTDKFKNRGPGGLGGFPSDLPSEILNPPRPTMPGFVDPSFDRDRFEKAMKGEVTLSKNEQGNIEATPSGMQAPPDYTPKSAYKDEIESVLRESKGARTDDVVNKIKEIEEREREKRAGRLPNRFPMGGNERSSFDIGVGGGPGDTPPRFPTGPRDPRTMRGPRKKEAVFFGEREPSSESKRPTKGGMKKAGSVPSPEAKNKFEEMLAYMKSFQR